MNGKNGHTNGVATSKSTTKKGLAQMLKGGVIMDVMNPEQAKIAEKAGACAVMALEKIPAHPGGGWRRAHERPEDDQRDPAGRFHSRDGKGPHWTLRRGA